jgi:hypothetical protein
MSQVKRVLKGLHDWYGQGYEQALGRSLSRVMQHARERSVGVISADRQGQTDAERLAARRGLISDIKEARLWLHSCRRRRAGGRRA